jgi:hypothetical protein
MRRLSLLLVAVLAGAPFAPSPLPAQTPVAGSREYQLRILEHERKFLLEMADSMPERFYRDRATPEQRDFAQQVHHAANGVVFLLTVTKSGPKPPHPQTPNAQNTPAGLRVLKKAPGD